MGLEVGPEPSAFANRPLSIVAAEGGRRRCGGRDDFPVASALWAPAWLSERALTSWAAFFTRLLRGGVRYRTTRLKRAATPLAELRQLHSSEG